MTTKIALSNIQDAVVTAITPTVPKITGISVTNSSYTVLDDTAVSISGGYIRITGTGFTAGSQVLIGTVAATSVSFVSSTELRAQLPATGAGTYVVYVVATDGSVAIRVNGITFSSTPTWSTGSTLTSGSTNVSISIQLAATSDTTVTYALAAGSSLPSGLSLSSSGVLSGTITGISVDTTYNFTVNAIDAENQDSPRAFSITITVVLQVARSLRFNRTNAYLTRTPASAGNRKTWTYSGWVKLTGIPTTTGDPVPIFGTMSAANDSGYFVLGILNEIICIQLWNTVFRRTTAVYRDYSAWYHIVVGFDTTQATAANRLKLYVNGVEVTAFSTSNDPALNTDYPINNSIAHNMFKDIASNYLGGYLTEVNFVDGLQLTPTSFGEADPNTGVWRPKTYTGSYGTNGFRLSFSNNTSTTTLGYDTSGNSNNWTANNFSVTAGVGNDSVVDSPTSYGTDTGLGGEVRGNYATFNPLQRSYGTIAYSNGNLVATNSDANWNAIGGTIGISTGKWYWEYTSGAQNSFFGFQVPTINYSAINPQDVNAAAGSVLICDDNQYKIDNNTRVSYGSTGHPSGTVVGIAVDMDAGTVIYYKNGTSLGTITWTSSAAYGKTVIPMAIVYDNGAVTRVNFGQRAFAYTAPTGFKALCSQNLPTPAIGATSTTQASKYFNTVLYTGNGNNTQSITVGFQPDFIWTKSRSNAYYHVLFDAVRGRGMLVTNNGNAEVTSPGTVYELTSYDSNGFTLGPDYSLSVNPNGSSMVAWNWNAGGTTVTNTTGSISSQVRANPTAGFSIVTYTGTGANATVGHGIGVAPAMVIVKQRNTIRSWIVYHTSLGATKFLTLDTTDVAQTAATFWNSTAPTSSVFSIGTDGSSNTSGGTYVAYCWAEVAGYSRFGSWIGNSSADGPFVYCGFRPAFVMLKIASGATANQWGMFDLRRSPINVVQNELYPNLSNAEVTGNARFDILSNGFKIRTSDTMFNNSGETHIFAAFAETPFKYARAR
jgi:hypothetical protein